VRFAWSGSTFAVRFRGSSVAMRLATAPLEPHGVQIDGKNVLLDEKTTAYTVVVDDRRPSTLQISADVLSYELASGLDPLADHEVTVTREAEAFAGVHELLGLDLAPGGTFLPPRSRSLRIEILGDSISCGYGVLGDGPRCPFTYRTERASAAYGARVGRALDADVTTVCWSGRGVLRNYDGSTTATMPELFELTLPAPPTARWSFSSAPPPAAVLVGLGTNDFLGGTGKPLDLAAFEDAYVKLAGRLREVYPAAWIFVLTSPMLRAERSPSGPGNVDALARRALARVVARRSDAGDRKIELITLDVGQAGLDAGWGCDMHPGEGMSARMAERIVGVLRARLVLDSP
jgi:lysophospholipase L1-like esterase